MRTVFWLENLKGREGATWKTQTWMGG